MNVTSTEQAGAGVQVTQPILQTKAKFRATDNPASSFVQAAEPGPRHIGYGLPCSKCGTYYMADLSVCPICKCAERISPTTLRAPAGLQNAQSLLDTEEPEEEREPFSKEFKSQLFSAPCESIRQPISAAPWKRTMRAATNQRRSADP